MRTSFPSIGFGLKRTADALFEPITLDEAKEHLVIETDDEDARLAALIVQARQLLEDRLGIALIRQTWQLTLDRFPGWRLGLPRPLLRSITSITYLDLNAVQQNLAANQYDVHPNSEPVGYLTPIFQGFWPLVRPVPETVVITYVAGADSRGGVPEPLRQEIRRLVAWLNENRDVDISQASISGAIKDQYGCGWEPEYY